MAALFRPGFWHKTRETLYNYRYSNSKRDAVWVEFSTYAELKRNIKKYLLETNEPHISVYRSRRGEWGEWVEKWELSNGKPKITNAGWQ